MKIASDGWFFVIPAFALAAVLWLSGLGLSSVLLLTLAVLATLATGFVAYFFRDPERTPPPGENLVLSPGDGTILIAEKRRGTDGREYQLVSIFLSVFNVHVNRIPISGRVIHVRHVPGKFHKAFEAAAVTENERTEITIKSGFGEVSFAQVAGILARRIVCRLNQNDIVTRGHRFGLIRFGSRIDLFLSPSVLLDVKPGDKVAGGESIIGRFAKNG